MPDPSSEDSKKSSKSLKGKVIILSPQKSGTSTPGSLTVPGSVIDTPRVTRHLQYAEASDVGSKLSDTVDRNPDVTLDSMEATVEETDVAVAVRELDDVEEKKPPALLEDKKKDDDNNKQEAALSDDDDLDGFPDGDEGSEYSAPSTDDEESGEEKNNNKMEDDEVPNTKNDNKPSATPTASIYSGRDEVLSVVSRIVEQDDEEKEFLEDILSD